MSMRDSRLLSVNGLEVIYNIGRGRLKGRRTSHRAVQDVTFKLDKGGTLGLVGESGCGKTSTARAVLGLVKVTSGEVLYEGSDITNAGRSVRAKLAESVQLIFQDPGASFNPKLSVATSLYEPLRIAGVRGSEASTLISEKLEQVGLGADYRKRLPHQLSGGQQQRVAIARALLRRPQLLICDEPVSALDVSSQAQVLNLFQQLQRDLGLAMLFISHDISVVRYLADEVVVMRGGSVVEQGDTLTVFGEPREAYTKQLVASVPRLPYRYEEVER